MTLVRGGQAGTIESGDIMISVAPAEAGRGIQIELVSPLIKQYGRQMKEVMAKVVAEYGVRDALIYANDKRALDCTIRARVRTALERAAREEQ